MTNPLISATFIYDGSAPPIIPERMLPKDPASIAARGQMQGTPMEQLVELAGRVCYDSLGVGRPSADYHKHILEVGHLSVLEHAVFTVRWECNQVTIINWALEFLNRPNISVKHGYSPDDRDQWFLEVTLNLRHVLEWYQVLKGPFPHPAKIRVLRHLAHQLAPAIVGPSDELAEDEVYFRLIDPRDDRQKWATYLLTGSRGFSHELVRHGDWTAISQRSTRYVDESESPWVDHPLTLKWAQCSSRGCADLDRAEERRRRTIASGGGAGTRFDSAPGLMTWEATEHAKAAYRVLVSELEPWLITRGVDKFSAKKQSRGAARGYLGNALYTEVVFSASLAQFKHMIRMRACAAADAEIREVFVQVFRDMAVRYADRFTGWTVVPAPDGIGEVVVPA